MSTRQFKTYFIITTLAVVLALAGPPQLANKGDQQNKNNKEEKRKPEVVAKIAKIESVTSGQVAGPVLCISGQFGPEPCQGQRRTLLMTLPTDLVFKITNQGDCDIVVKVDDLEPQPVPPGSLIKAFANNVTNIVVNCDDNPALRCRYFWGIVFDPVGGN